MTRTLGSLLFIIYLNLTLLKAGTITSTVESKEILKGESILLTITIVGQEFDTLPNIPRISGAKVLGSNRSMKTRIITVNGKAVMEQTSVLILEFRPTTDIVIPAFQMRIDNELKSSEPINIRIVSTKPKSSQEAKFLIEMNATKTSVMVGEALITNVFFKQKRGVDILSIDYKEPLFKEFFSKRIGEEKRFNDGNYTVQKLSYLLIAKQDGNFTINPARVRVAEREKRSQVNGWFATTPKWSSAQSLGINIQVKKALHSVNAVGSYRLSDSIDTQEIEVNKPVNLKFMIEGEGSLEDFEGIKFDISGVTIYSDDAKIESKVVNDKLFSSYTKSYAFISAHDFEIPSKEITVYDYNSKTLKTLRTKAYKIVVNAGSSSSDEPTVYTKNSVDINSVVKDTSAQKSITDIRWEVPSYLMLILSFFIGAVLALLFRPYFSKLKNIKIFKSKKIRVNMDEALLLLYPHMNENVEVENMVRLLYMNQKGKDIEIDKTELEVLVQHYQKRKDTLMEDKG